MSRRGHQFGVVLLLAAILLLAARGVAASKAQAVDEQARQALARAEQGIARYRQGDAVVKVRDHQGRLVGGARVKIRQVSHDFNFGCYLTLRGLDRMSEEQYGARFAQLFNYATVGLYWDVVEGARGGFDWQQVDREVQWGWQRKLRLKGHPLVWGYEPSGAPPWLPRHRDELAAALKEHVQATIKRYRGRVDTWDVVAEPLDGGLFEQVLGKSYIKDSFRWAREADPQARLAINEYGILGAEAQHRERYLKLLEEMIADQVDFDIIGIQGHEPRTEWFNPRVVMATLDRFSALKKPIHITELTVQGTGAAITGNYRQGEWNAEEQGRYYREFFTLCFGHPQVEAITVWGLDDARAWLAGGGLLDLQWRPKPAFAALDQLINREWRTVMEAVTMDGVIKFRGFYGDYEVEVELPGGPRLKEKFALRCGTANVWPIQHRER
jgi:GH35 family endo-1,4-beta-xylanase